MPTYQFGLSFVEACVSLSGERVKEAQVKEFNSFDDIRTALSSHPRIRDFVLQNVRLLVKMVNDEPEKIILEFNPMLRLEQNRFHDDPYAGLDC